MQTTGDLAVVMTGTRTETADVAALLDTAPGPGGGGPLGEGACRGGGRACKAAASYGTAPASAGRQIWNMADLSISNQKTSNIYNIFSKMSIGFYVMQG